jgi:glycosyltransferase involved in cell wall biosynthesis
MVSEHASPLAVLGGVDAGGQNVHVASLARALGRRGAAVTVYTRRDAASLPRRVAFAPRVWVEHVDAGPPEPVPKDALLPYMDEFALRLARCFRGDRPDLVHAHFWMSGKAALAASLPLALPVLQTFHALGVVKRRHQGTADTSPPERIAIERELIERTTGIVATCRDEVEELRELGASLPRVRIVPCGVDLSLFRPDGPIAPRGSFRHRVVVVTRLVERKGVDVVIRALAALPDTELVVAGGPEAAALGADPETRRLLGIARELGVAERVTLLGRLEREQVPALLRSADAVACCPWYEPFGIVPLEAMACGVPVVASSVGGLLDTVTGGVTGIHVPPRDPGAVAAALGRLLDDAAARSRLGAAGAVRAHLGYGWDHIAAATLSAYRALALRRGRHPRAVPAAAASARSRREGSLHGVS